ncbi:hypothetical protein DYB32_003959 [Aphanomyces invadans]|uniref:EF-hand domain-containing protein n=1 Tax=Aphanomyces invadans TaxID=157072 RepID=A0A418AYZ8_9STRA|nr:hypothetical protein DYB32_003959 [Aphanomyces invadans]
MKLLSSLLTFKGMGALAPDCGSSVVSLVKVYTGVTKATQATVASRFPPEILAMLPFVETLSPNALMTMAPLAQEIFIDASSAGAIQPATAVKVHTAFFEVLSEKERRQLVRMLPAKEQELVTHVVETTEGLSPRGVETVVHMLLQSTNHSLPSQPSKNHSPPQPFVVPGPNETSVHQPLADHTYGAIDIPDAPPPPSRDAVMAKLALTATKAHGRRLMRWVRSAPRSLRVLSFVSSVLLFVTACISMVLDVVAGPMIVVVINMWIVVFSLIMVSVEVKITAIEKHNSIATYFPLVRTVTGRGAFLLFISLIAMTLAVKATWQNAVLGVAGVVAAGISLWSIALGSIASHQFNALRSRIESLAQLKQAFDLADVDRAGELDVDGLGRFCLVWDWPIDVYFLEAIVRDLDGHNSNAVSLSDLQVWWTVTTSEVAMYMMLDLWVILFGMIVVVVDAPPTWSHALNGCKRIVLDNFASFLATPVGRSFFCLFLSTFVVSVYQNDSVYLPMVTSACLALVSLVYTCVGRSAKRQFFLLAKAVDGTNCSRVFAAADNDGDGVWSLDELDAFCRAQHVVLSAAQWEVLVADLDQHHVGAITLHDFTTWVQLQHRNMS